MIRIERKKSIVESIKIFGIGSSGAFNPNWDGNALAWYDGNVGLTVARWNDQGAGGHDIVFANLPTIVANATPLRDAVLFDGINQNGQVATPAINNPFSIYIVERVITWVGNGRLFDDGLNASRKYILCHGATPNLGFYCGAFTPSSNPDLAIGTYGVMTCVGNGANSEIRTNLNAAVIGNAGLNNGDGIIIGSNIMPLNHLNCEIGYLIIRTGADSTATQNIIINALRGLCGLTF